MFVGSETSEIPERATMAMDQRIEQFKKMAREDPDNELGHFSLGKAYLEGGQPTDAIEPLKRVIELKPTMSKAYQLLGEAFDQAGRRKDALATLTKGVTVADQQGDRMPLSAMVQTLESWGAVVPAIRPATKPVGAEPTTGAAEGFRCTRCGRPSGQLPKPPFKGKLGQMVFEHTCSSCFREWIPMGTKVINELGLSLNSPQGQAAYDQYMAEFLQLEDL
jgi:Fe-S cluster biosynthesis and repair protein YggX